MRGIKHLSTLLIIALALTFVGTASAQTYDSSSELQSIITLNEAAKFQYTGGSLYLGSPAGSGESTIDLKSDTGKVRINKDYFSGSDDKIEAYESSSLSNKLGTMTQSDSNLTIDTSQLDTGSIVLKWTDGNQDDYMGIKSVVFLQGQPADQIDAITTEEYLSAFADYVRPSSLSCALGFSNLFSSCWSLFDINIGSEDKQTFLNDVEANAGVIVEERKETLNNLGIINQQSYGISQAQAKKTAISELNNNVSNTEARNTILEDIDDFWTSRESNIITQHQLEVQQFKNTLATADSLAVGYGEVFHRNSSEYRISEKNYTLINGTTTKIYNVYDNSGNLVHSPVQSGSTGLETADGREQFLAADQYNTERQAVIDQRQQAYDNVQTLVDSIYSNYQPSELDPSQVLGPLEALKTSATNYAETGGTSYLATTFEQMGLSTDFEKAFTVTYQNTDMNSSKQVEGQLFGSPSDFTNGFDANTTYDASSKTAWMVYQPQDGPAQSVNFDNTFTVDNIQNLQTGEEINNTEIQQQEFYTSNITELENQLQEIRAAQEDLRDSGGGTSGINKGLLGLSGTLGGLLIVLMLILAGAFIA